ncbi:MAG: hypothetical protein LBW85_01800 [Deltaproteobacteria bacterium]|jgi:flavodoxin|nr:hypothetical protein [Deltaproteobacteria bacterium]
MKHPLATLLTLPLTLILLAGPAAQAQEAAPGGPAADPDLGKTLVTVFSQTGKTRLLAEAIASKTGGDLYLIEPAAPYPADEREIIALEEARRYAGAPPELKGSPPDLSPYSFVFVGSPVWFGEPPDHVKLFLESVDFGGKHVALFATAGTRPGDVIEKLGALIVNGQVLSPSLLQVRADDWGEAAVSAKVDGFLAQVREARAKANVSPASARQ